MQHGSYPKMYLYKRIVQAKLFIDKNYAERIDCTQIAEEACFSQFHFLRLFKAAYGKTTHSYLTEGRIRQARSLLEKRVAVAEVCSQVGFESVATFSALYKRSTGMSPSIYQAQQVR